jgi:uncharacterized membrane protein YciS (DUF1049 family)
MYLGNIINVDKEKMILAMNINKQKLLMILVIVILIVGIVVLGLKYFDLKKQLESTQAQLKNQEANAKIVSFTNLFVEKVLMASGEVSVEDRLRLENGVRGLNDRQIMNLWQTFTESSTPDEVQRAGRDLLVALVKKISLSYAK